MFFGCFHRMFIQCRGKKQISPIGYRRIKARRRPEPKARSLKEDFRLNGENMEKKIAEERQTVKSAEKKRKPRKKRRWIRRLMLILVLLCALGLGRGNAAVSFCTGDEKDDKRRRI